ncbi:coiled-coil domain-containing protein 150 isoform X1 [Amphiprion ocellaris]|uniref:coiled-coil domain-containing protein 150 isoform X1 n=1 Tax=Amphiprion ocellaris TaxID=80972 RepID=UPI001649AE14|nr:coiled-coil domain-containing protein 150 isoform X1 [Amphiprion ocellaris]
MSCPAVQLLGVGAPEPLILLHQRLLLAEQETEGLIRDLCELGVSRDQILESSERLGSLSPLKMRWTLGDESILWEKYDSLVNQMCRIESLLQTLKLTVFRLETDRELDPSHTAHLKQQLAALQRESQEEQQASRKELIKLRDQLLQAYQERDEARTQVQRLEDTLEAAAAAKLDVALAAEELKTVKLEMSQKLMEMTEQMMQESTRSNDAIKSFSELLRRVEDMERVVEMERRQALLLQTDCQARRVEVQSSRQQLAEEKDRGRQLEKLCQQLKEQAAMKNSLVSELKTEVKSVHVAHQRQQIENNKLLKEARELRAAADRLQIQNKHLQSQCSQLSSALRSLTAENEKQQFEHQACLMAERSRVFKQLQEQDLLLEAARCNVQTELQVAVTDSVRLQKELEKLKGEHAHLLQSSSITQETAATQKKLLEQTIERLREELSTVREAEEAMRKDLEAAKNELCLVVTKLEAERSDLDTQLREARREVGSLSSDLQNQQDENRRLMGKVSALEQQQDAVQHVDQTLKDLSDKNKLTFENRKLKISELLGICGPAEGVVRPTSISRLQLNSQTPRQELEGREQELVTLKKDRMQAQREIRKHQAEVEKLQELLTSAHWKNNRALESLQKAFVTARGDNKKLAHSLEQAVLTNSSLHRKLEQARDQYQATIMLRDDELREAQTKISHLSTDLSAIKQRSREDYQSSMKTLHREISELKMTVKDSSTKSSELSKTNEDLHRRVSELERLVSKQKACIREQRSQLRQQQKSRDLQDSCQKVEQRLEERIRNLLEKEQTDGKLPEVRMESEQVISKREAELERWTSTIQRWEAKRELAQIAGGYKPVRTQLITQPH